MLYGQRAEYRVITASDGSRSGEAARRAAKNPFRVWRAENITRNSGLAALRRKKKTWKLRLSTVELPSLAGLAMLGSSLNLPCPKCAQVLGL